MAIFQITVETDNPRAREHVRRLTEDCLAGVDIGEEGLLWDATITTIEITNSGCHLVWQTNLQPDEDDPTTKGR